MVNSFQAKIYNTHLYVSRVCTNKPFTPRSNFDNLEDNKLNQLVLLESFFNKHHHLNMKMYFMSPYKVYTDCQYYDLAYYTKPIALKTYYLYTNLLDHQSPDHKDQIEFLIDSLKFIKKFCIDNNINLNQYLKFSKSVTYSWCEHLLSNNISIYSILAFSYNGYNVYSLIGHMPPDESELFLDRYSQQIPNLMSNLNKSKLAKDLLISGFKKINNSILQALTSSSKCNNMV